MNHRIRSKQSVCQTSRCAALLMLLSCAATPTLSAQSAGEFTATGNMSTPRYFHTATLLADGRVLIAGGASAVWGGPTVVEASAERYDPSSGAFTATGNMTIARWNHTATLLPDGKVLIAGGSVRSNSEPYAASTAAELYDPSTGTFTATGNLTTARTWHTATLLADGRVLIVGGIGDVDGKHVYLSSAELYDSSSRTFTSTGDMLEPLADTATLLANGSVLITKSIVGWDPARAPSEIFVRHAELYNPSTGTFAATGDMVTFHASPTATLLTNGKVLIAGGDIGDGDGPSAVAEVYDPDTGIFTRTGSMTSPREGHTSTLLSDGTVLVAGAHNGGTRTPGGGTDNFSGAELYDPATGQFHTTNFMGTGRDDHRATALKDGQVLITGGSQYYPFGAGERPRVYGLLSSAELYTVLGSIR